MKFELTLDQFLVFSRYLWGPSPGQGFNDRENIWVQIAKKEVARTFSDGLPYCPSALQLSQGYGRSWKYRTTSGTEIYLEEKVMDLGSELPKVSVEVEIQNDRAQPGRTHFSYVEVAQAGLPFMEGDQYEEENTPEKIAICNIFSGMSQKERQERAKQQEEERAAKRAAKKEYDEYDEYDEDELLSS
jgi:hypothetical protein